MEQKPLHLILLFNHNMEAVMKAMCLLFCLLLSVLALAQVPHLINYQGYLTGPTSYPIADGDYDITFSI